MAPMAGITDRAFREIVKAQGADYTTTEMISAKGLYYKDKGTDALLDRESGESTGIQIFGSDPDIISQVIRDYINPLDFDFLDFNMGCPAPKIFKNNEGSYLMSQPDLAYEILRAMVKESTRPVHLKIRLGISQENKNFLEIGRLAQRAGVDKICLHARTRSQFYQGKADLDAIKALVEEVKIPIIGNGDVTDSQSALAMLEYTGCQSIMIGRGALGNPFIFREIKAGLNEEAYQMPTKEELYQLIQTHYKKILAYKGPRALSEMRKHMGWYLKGQPGSARVKNDINQANTLEEVEKILEDYFLRALDVKN